MKLLLQLLLQELQELQREIKVMMRIYMMQIDKKGGVK